MSHDELARVLAAVADPRESRAAASDLADLLHDDPYLPSSPGSTCSNWSVTWPAPRAVEISPTASSPGMPRRRAGQAPPHLDGHAVAAEALGDEGLDALGQAWRVGGSAAAVVGWARDQLGEDRDGEIRVADALLDHPDPQRRLVALRGAADVSSRWRSAVRPPPWPASPARASRSESVATSRALCALCAKQTCGWAGVSRLCGQTDRRARCRR